MKHIICLSIILISGCISILRVYEDDTTGVKSVDGIPFFKKTVAYKQTTVYQRYKLNLLLTKNVLDDTDKLIKSDSIVYSKQIGKRGREKLSELEQLLVTTNAQQSNEEVVLKIINLFNSIEPATTDDFIKDKEPILNTLEEIVTVDYSRTFYLNAPLPWFGNGNINVDLNPDGTLSKGSSNVTMGLTDILKAVLDVLPIKELISAKLHLPSVAGSKGLNEEVPAKNIEFKLSIEKIGYIYEFTKIYKIDPRFDKDNNPKPLDPIDFIDNKTTSYPYTKRPIEASKKH